MSGGDEGLFEYNASKNYNDYFSDGDPFRCITGKHSSYADFNFLSIYNSSIVGKSFLSVFKMPYDSDYRYAFKEKILIEEIQEDMIFGSTPIRSLSWGVNEKLYKASGTTLEVVNFNNYSKDQDYFANHKVFGFQPWKGKILRGGTAYFGTIIECENAVVVLTGEQNFFNIPGAATRWRVYPRSFNYENHLHIIQDDRLEIFSFNNDFFQNQNTKSFGIKFTEKVEGANSRFAK